jgi:hypothetical protein
VNSPDGQITLGLTAFRVLLPCLTGTIVLTLDVRTYST